MKVLQLHNRYKNLGGEDTVLGLERELLHSYGHLVPRMIVSNETLEVRGIGSSIKYGLSTVWSQQSYRTLDEVLRREKPDLLHVHNTFPQFSPSVYWAAAKLRTPIVQTLHNYRLACANGLLLRDGAPCELCVGNAPLPALRYKCYRNSLPATGAVVAMQVAHRSLGTYSKKVDAYIALTGFQKSLMVRSGLPPELVHVKPNFVPDPLPSLPGLPDREDQVVFVGRLAGEKGADLLLEAWRRSQPSGFRLVVVGDGPERVHLEEEFSDLPGVVWRGWSDREGVLSEVARSRYLVMPSRWYETFGMVLIEALALGTPIVAPNHGGFLEVVKPGNNGLLFSPSDVESLMGTLNRALKLDVRLWQQWSKNARGAYLRYYSPETNYRLLMTIYEKAIDNARSRDPT